MENWNKNEKFMIILEKQTPKTESFDVQTPVWIKENMILLKEFLLFSSGIKTALGVAANQVSFNGNCIMKRFFSLRKGRNEDDPFDIIIDPKITKKYGNPVTELEGCLSWPGRTIKANRWLKIDVEYYDISGNKTSETLNRDLAQVWQHEMDHLNGIEEIISGPITIENKIGRNDPCPCGSSLKYKKCCQK